MIASAWSEVARCSGTLSAAVNHDRSVFRPRAPAVLLPLVRRAVSPLRRAPVNALTSPSAPFVERTYYMSRRETSRRSIPQASQDGGGHPHEALSAYLWKAFAAAGRVRREPPHGLVGERAAPSRRAEAARRRCGSASTSATSPRSRVAEARGGGHPPASATGHRVDGASETIRSTATDEHFQQQVDWVEEHRATKYVETACVGLGSPAVTVTSFATFSRTPTSASGACCADDAHRGGLRRLCSLLQIIARSGGDGWPVNVCVAEASPPRFDFRTSAGIFKASHR
ncbi:hypothetical protein ZWY2020_005656 [Hordeum vulgare]|nr:hypothetical protein ZWY2020_005656 [Hordeum vulgare]